MEKRVLYRLIAVITVLLFATAIVLGAVAMSYDGGGSSFSVNLRRENISYSAETALRYSILMAPLFGTGNSIPPFDQLDIFVDNLYSSFLRAGVSEEKLHNILDGVEAMGLRDSTESPILAFFERSYDQAMSGDGDTALENIVTEEEVQRAIYKSYLFLTAAGMNVDDVGRVLYEMALLYSDGKRTELLTSLGRNDFTMLTIGSYAVYRATTELAAEFSTIQEARILGQALTSLGQSFRNAVESLGADGIDGLLFLDYRINEENNSVNADFAAKYNALMDNLSGAVWSVLNLAASVLTNLNPLLFEELYFANVASGLGDEASSDAHTVWAMFDLARTIKNGLATAASLDGSYSTEEEAVNYFTGVSADYNLFNDLIYNETDSPTREQYEAAAREKAEEFLGALNGLYQASDSFRSFDELKAYSSENAEGFASLLEKAQFISGYQLNLESSVTRVFSTLTKAAILRIFTGTAVPQAI